jgi:hypothetical protein
VSTKTIDDWALENQIFKIDFLWLDMQGMELQVLKASPQILQTVAVIHTEVHYMENYKGVPLVSQLKEWLFGQGFQIFLETQENINYGNITFIRSKISI